MILFFVEFKALIMYILLPPENKEAIMITKDNYSKKCDIASLIIVGATIFFVLFSHLMVAAITGMLIYTVSSKISRFLELKTNMGKYARTLSILLVVIFISAIIGSAILGLLHLFKTQSNSGFSWLLLTTADMLDKARQSLPDSIASHIPNSVDQIRERSVIFLKEHSRTLSTVGINSLHSIAGLFIGIVAGAMLSFANFKDPEEYNPLSKYLLLRFTRLRQSFDQIVSAQVQISLLNTLLTFIYLVCVLPLFGYHLPLTKTIILVTFLAGLIPVLGNLISNTFIVIVSAGVGLHIGIASLVFLIVIHKLEYFLNAKIIGNKINASPWELIFALVFMEVLFGMPGVIAAPVLYCYIKHELKLYGLIGNKTE